MVWLITIFREFSFRSCVGNVLEKCSCFPKNVLDFYICNVCMNPGCRTLLLLLIALSRRRREVFATSASLVPIHSVCYLLRN